jgi:hypothetical protein
LVHRSSALKIQPTTKSISIAFIMALIAIAILECCWFAWFVVEPLPNAGIRISRWFLICRSVPQVFIAGFDYSRSNLGVTLDELSQFENLPQRLPIVLAAGFIAVSAITTGNLILRGLRLRNWLTSSERIAVGYGLGTTILGLATLILGRMGLIGPWPLRIGLVLPILAELVCWVRFFRARDGVKWRWTAGLWPMVGLLVVVGPFLLIMALGAMLPTVDFDAIEYHVQGPKEYFQAGRIAFLPHNVYTSMPFSIEMLHLLGMEFLNDWWLGALVGQLLIAGFATAAAVLIASTARRIGSPRAGWVAAVVYLTTPWIYRLGVLPYVEGPLCYFHSALIWAITVGQGLPCRDDEDGRASPTLRIGSLAGFLAGGAMATKYPALISAVIPFSFWALWASWRERNWRVAIGFALGVVLVMAPWLGKNVIDTGNPVYPLGYKVFGASHWNAARDAKWSAAHGPKAIEVGAFFRSIVDIAGRSDWQSPLFTALVPLAFFRQGSRRAAGWLAIYSSYLFLTWWLFTHRLDRFWLPILPGLAILAGLGADWTRSKTWTVLLSLLLILGLWMNAAYCTTTLAGLNEWMSDLTKLRTSVPKRLNAPLARLDAELPPGSKPLLVGQAAVFHLNRPIVYNTVFNEETIETLAKGRSPGEFHEELRKLGVTHVYVDWSEINRYRSPGNYGFTPFVTYEFFQNLVNAGVLEPPVTWGPRQELYRVREPIKK